MQEVFGCAAFALFFLGDWNDWKWGRRTLRLCFPAGLLLLAGATVSQCREGRLTWQLIPAALFLGLLIHTLFFAFPTEDAYIRQGKGRPACTTGVYALCRHPGVLWFIGLYLCLWQGVALPLHSALLYCGLNLLLILFEDRCVFPTNLEGYRAYRETTPFLIPNRASIQAFLGK